jgi:hypothetical protein
MTKPIIKKQKGNFRKKSNKRNSKSSTKRRSQRGGNPMMASPMMESPMMESPMMESPMMEKPLMKPMPPMQGGNPMMETPMMESPMMASPMMEKPLMKPMQGGSPASSLVMSSFDSPPVMNDYVADPRIRNSDNSAGDMGGCQLGGGTASDMVLSQLNDVAQTADYPEGYKVTGDINSLNLYAPSGGAKKRKAKKNKRSNKKRSNRNKKSSKRTRRNKSQHSRMNNSRDMHNNNVMRGGHASDWISSQYSLGSINGASMNGNTGDFSNSEGVSRDILMNPPTLGLAGSGYPMGALEGANVSGVGAPLV